MVLRPLWSQIKKVIILQNLITVVRWVPGMAFLYLDIFVCCILRWPQVDPDKDCRNLGLNSVPHIDESFDGIPRRMFQNIVTWCQFHQHFTQSFYACRSQKRQITLKTWLYFFVHWESGLVKAAHKTMMKLTPGYNSWNVINVKEWTFKSLFIYKRCLLFIFIDNFKFFWISSWT